MLWVFYVSARPCAYRSQPTLQLPSSNSRLTMSTLPPEITDLFMDHMHDDKLTLSVCAAVCRRWLPGCQFHLFRQVTYWAREREGHFTPLISFLRVAAHLRGLIRSLILDGSTAGETRCDRRGSESHDLSHLQLYEALRFLPGLRTLVLRSVSFPRVAHWTELERHRFQTRSPPGFHIENLILDSAGYLQNGVALTTTVDLEGLLSIFTSIGNLRMCNLSFFPTEHSWPSVFVSRGDSDREIGPASVSMDGCSALYLPFRCLEKRPPKSLTVRCRDVLSVGKYLRSVGWNLVHLDLDLELGLDGELSVSTSFPCDGRWFSH